MVMGLPATTPSLAFSSLQSADERTLGGAAMATDWSDFWYEWIATRYDFQSRVQTVCALPSRISES